MNGYPRGEAADVVRLRLLSPMLSHLLAAKGISEEAMAARRLRDGAYTLVVQTESRLRTGATARPEASRSPTLASAGLMRQAEALATAPSNGS